MIEDIGFEATPKNEGDGDDGDDAVESFDLQILGMTCAACSGSIESAVSAMEGVNTCSVSGTPFLSSSHVANSFILDTNNPNICTPQSTSSQSIWSFRNCKEKGWYSRRGRDY